MHTKVANAGVLIYSQKLAICKTRSPRTALTIGAYSESVQVYCLSVDPRLILVLNEVAATCSTVFFFSPAHLFRLSFFFPNASYFLI